MNNNREKKKQNVGPGIRIPREEYQIWSTDVIITDNRNTLRDYRALQAILTEMHKRHSETHSRTNEVTKGR